MTCCKLTGLLTESKESCDWTKFDNLRRCPRKWLLKTIMDHLKLRGHYSLLQNLMKPWNLLIQKKFVQEQSKKRAVLDWELQQRQADCDRKIRPSDAYDPCRLLLVVEKFVSNHLPLHICWFPTTHLPTRTLSTQFLPFFSCVLYSTLHTPKSFVAVKILFHLVFAALSVPIKLLLASQAPLFF